METKIQVGCMPSKDNACKPEDYPLCSELKSEMDIFFDVNEMVHGKNKMGEEDILFLRGGDDAMPKGARRLVDRDDPKTPGNDSEVDRALYEGILSGRGYDGFCKIHEPDKEKGGSEYRWFAVDSLRSFLTFRNEELQRCVMLDKSDIELSVGEMKVLVPLLNLSTTDMATKPGYAPKLGPDGKFTTGLYHFTADETRLDQMMKQLDDAPFKLRAALMMTGTYFKIENHIEKVKEAYNTQMEAIDSQGSAMSFGTVVGGLSLLATGVLLLIFGKNLKLSKQQLDKQDKFYELAVKQSGGDVDANKFEAFSDDFIEMQKEKLGRDVLANEIRGRDREAIDFLHSLADMDASNPRLTGGSGVGKDKVAERAAQLIALKDFRVPRQFLDGTIKGLWKIDYARFSAQAGIVGHNAQRLAAVDAKMKGGYAVYLSEIADVMTMGSHSGGSAESFASVMKSPLTESYSRFASSTTPGSWDTIVSQNPWIADHERRFPGIEISDISVDTLKSIFNDVRIPALEAYHKVTITPEAREAAINLALITMSDESVARYDAIDKLLKTAVREVVMERGARSSNVIKIDKDRIVRVISEQAQMSIDPDAKFPDTAGRDAYAEGEYFGEKLMESMKKDAWFDKLSNGARREAVRIAGSHIFEEGGWDKYVDADGQIKKVKELAREVKGRMTEMPIPAAPAVAAASAPEPKPAEKPVDRGEAGLEGQARIIRKRLIKEAQDAPADAKSKIGFDFRDFSSEEQEMIAMDAAEILEAAKESGEYRRYLDVDLDNDKSSLRPGAAHELLAEAMKRKGDLRSGLAMKVGARVERDVRKSGREGKGKAKGKGLFERARDWRKKGK